MTHLRPIQAMKRLCSCDYIFESVQQQQQRQENQYVNQVLLNYGPAQQNRVRMTLCLCKLKLFLHAIQMLGVHNSVVVICVLNLLKTVQSLDVR